MKMREEGARVIKTPNGYIVVSAVESFRVVYSPGYHDHQHVLMTLTSEERDLWEAALRRSTEMHCADLLEAGR